LTIKLLFSNFDIQFKSRKMKEVLQGLWETKINDSIVSIDTLLNYCSVYVMDGKKRVEKESFSTIDMTISEVINRITKL
jgi:hypothetical protein